MADKIITLHPEDTIMDDLYPNIKYQNIERGEDTMPFLNSEYDKSLNLLNYLNIKRSSSLVTPTNNGLYIQKGSNTNGNNVWVQFFNNEQYAFFGGAQDSSGIMKLQFTKNNTFNILEVKRNGNIEDGYARYDISYLEDGIYTLYIEVDLDQADGVTRAYNMMLYKGDSNKIVNFEPYHGEILHKENLPDYSFNEVNTHQKWVNGKDIYRRVIVVAGVGYPPQTWNNVVGKSWTMSTIINGRAIDENGNMYPVVFGQSSSHLQIMQFRNVAITLTTFIIEYTK